VARFSDVRISDVVIDQNLALYLPDGSVPICPASSACSSRSAAPARRQTLDGQREIQITVGNRVWVRRPTGVVELPAVEPLRALPNILIR